MLRLKYEVHSNGAAPREVKEMALPLGNWDIDGNGFRGTLTINEVDGAGNLNASVVFESPEVQQVIGFWDEPSQKITFVRVINQNDPSANQIYTGFRFDNERDHLTDRTHTLTGYFEAFQGTGAVASRVLYGWVASITVVG